jgi:hypothetical protein
MKLNDLRFITIFKVDNSNTQIRIKKSKKIIQICVLILLTLGIISACPCKEKSQRIQSPNGNISVHFSISQNKNAYYAVKFGKELIIKESKLGIIRDDDDFSKNLSLDSVSSIEFVKDDYEMLVGKKRNCSYNANRKVFYLKNANGKKMNIAFQVSNDGVAFRYCFPGKSKQTKKIINETSSFNFISGTKAYIQHSSEAKSGWCQVNPGYEEFYEQNVEIEKLRFNNAGWVFPALFNYGEYWILLSETASDRNYCGCRLQQDSVTNEFFIEFPQKEEKIFEGELNPESQLPWKTPWRIIVIGKGLKTIVESTLGTDLAEPSRLKDISFVRPGQSSWSWVLLKDDSTVYDVQKRFIDYASEMNWEYCLIDADWDKKIGYEKLSELSEYAKNKGVGILAWYNSSGNWNETEYSPKSKLLNHKDRLEEFAKIKEMEIKGVKVDFFGGDGQSVMAYYQDIFEDAAEFELMVNCHGATLPRGWQRTYPNLVTVEAIRGFEYVTFGQFDADNESNHSCMLPFTRNAFDPMDFTPVCFSEVPNIKRMTSNAFELALSVIFYSGIQHFAETPRGMKKVPDYVKNFLREIPNHWEDTKFIDGFPGKFVVIARKSNNTWYVAGINGQKTDKQLKFKLPFIKETKSASLITDGKDARSFNMEKIIYTPDGSFEIKLKGNGGFVLKFDN